MLHVSNEVCNRCQMSQLWVQVQQARLLPVISPTLVITRRVDRSAAAPRKSVW